jgi:hypothetical protein
MEASAVLRSRPCWIARHRLGGWGAQLPARSHCWHHFSYGRCVQLFHKALSELSAAIVHHQLSSVSLPEVWDSIRMMPPNQSAAATRRPAGKIRTTGYNHCFAKASDGSGNLSAIVAADRAFPAAVAELGR